MLIFCCVCKKEVMNIMDANIPEEIQEKLVIIEKEADFYQKMKPPQNIFRFGGLLYLIIAIAMFIYGKEYLLAAFFLLPAFIYISGYFQYKKIYELHSNARDIINYYRNREGIK